MNDNFNQKINTGPDLKQAKPKGVMVIAILFFIIAGISAVQFIQFKNSNPLAYQISSLTGDNAVSILVIIGLIALGIGLWKLNSLVLWTTVILAILIIFNTGKIIKKDISARTDAAKSFQELIDRDNSSPLLKSYAAKEEENRKISQNSFNREIIENGFELAAATTVAIYLVSRRNRFS